MKDVDSLWWEGADLHVVLTDGQEFLFKNATITSMQYLDEEGNPIKSEPVNVNTDVSAEDADLIAWFQSAFDQANNED